MVWNYIISLLNQQYVSFKDHPKILSTDQYVYLIE